MQILVTGKNGQLGSEIQQLKCNYPEYNFVFTDRNELDISDEKSVKSFFLKNEIDLIINCAAYTAVDKSEDEVELSYCTNVTGVKNLIEICENTNKKLIHISTDYVFDGTSNIPYKESDPVNPISVYGKTKREGEEIVLNSTVDALIIRTSWIYSSFGNNFVKTMLRIGKDKERLDVIYDQIGTPTYAKDLANACLSLVSKTNQWQKDQKIYHFSNEGITSWYDFATAIMEISEIDCTVMPIETFQYITKAVRPQYSVLNKRKIKDDFKIEIRHWRSALNEMLKELTA